METSGDAMDGNTKTSISRVNQLSGWFFTWNNYPNDAPIILETCFKKICKKYVFEHEVGENGTPHLQGCIVLKKAMRWSEFKLPKQINWSKTRNEEKAIEYCQKDHESKGNQIWKFGFPKPIHVDEPTGWQIEARDTLLEECKTVTNREFYWWYEEVGKFGKSSFCKYMMVKHNACVIQGGKMADIMNIIMNINMDEVPCVIIDIPRAHKNKVSYSAIECILNGMITNTKFETGFKVFNPPQLMVLSNFPPETGEDTLSADRFNIRNLRGRHIFEFPRLEFIHNPDE